MNNPWKQPQDWSSIDLHQRKQWYNNLGEAYHQTRPDYDPRLIRRILDLTQLSPQSQLLELGCGTGKATLAFAPFHLSLLCLEPNREFYAIAQENCQNYPKIGFKLTSFEEWQPEDLLFDGIIAANSFHWLPPDISYPKTARLLKAKGYLILLWNLSLQLPWEIYQEIRPIYQTFAPHLDRYESTDRQQEIIDSFGKLISDSQFFYSLFSESITQKVTYSVDNYITLLSTYSPYIALEPNVKISLFSALKDSLTNMSQELSLTYLSAFHLARKK